MVFSHDLSTFLTFDTVKGIYDVFLVCSYKKRFMFTHLENDNII